MNRILSMDNLEVFKSVYLEHYPLLIAYVRKNFDTEGHEEDIVHEVFLNIWKKQGRISVKESSVRAYLLRAVRNKSLDWCAKHGRKSSVTMALETTAEISVAPSDDSRYLENKELEQEIRDAVEALPPRCKEVFVLSRYSDMSHKEISEVTGLTPKTVENYMARAYKKMRQSLKNYLVSFVPYLLMAGTFGMGWAEISFSIIF
ncbi:DNA-directed RNA polymerase sigma-70 factor [Fulvitalea axinellae]|uniref:DNA-directed RNA polymerase sigma-70 factor n=1 Tax=Fulvitalea axinellae TaxID=1182444 RepID=A0AAU9CDD7_9BACT|nr:DNA-directed RNA polymerase sigma-70 factor [Fulvitalea axinellae]